MLQRRDYAILLDDLAKLANQIPVQLLIVVAFFLGIAAVIDADLLLRVVQLPVLVLVFLVKIDDKERMLKVNEKVSHVSILLRFFLIGDNVKIAVSIFVSAIDLLLELFFVVATRDVFDAKVCT